MTSFVLIRKKKAETELQEVTYKVGVLEAR